MESRKINKIPAGILRDARIKLDEVQKILEPYALETIHSEKQITTKKGTETFEFLKLSNEFAKDFPLFFRGSSEAEVFKKNYSFFYDLQLLVNKANTIKEIFNRHMITASLTILESACLFYNTVRIAARRNLPCAGAIYEKLKPKYHYHQRRRARRVHVS